MKKLNLICLALIFTTINIFANNLRISDGTQVSSNQISFTMSWENSWMVGGAPGNYDAVWVFIKYRECGGTGPYVHALLSTTMSDHDFGTTFSAATPVSLADRFGVVPAGATATNGLGNNTGVMIRRSDFDKGDISGTCTLKIVSATGDPFLTGVNYEIKVIGIEMVFVREEPFTLGDGGAQYNSSFSVWGVNNEDAIPANTLLAAHSLLPAEYPKGYKGFYCMKYEISEGQFYKFMTTGGTIMGGPADYFTSNRNNLSFDGTTTPDRAQNFISWGALLAYLDWAALRPMTELEYEKACKGSGSMANQGFAWGSNKYIKALYISGTEDGTETIVNGGANAHFLQLSYPTDGTYIDGASAYAASNKWWWDGFYPPGLVTSSASCCPWVGQYAVPSATEMQKPVPKNYGLSNGGTSSRMGWMPLYKVGTTEGQGFGPLRVGIFSADATRSRETTGATFYGIMEMSGNVWEQCVNINTTGYTGIWGNGYISGVGADVSGWPAGTAARCLRGGSYGHPIENLRVCDRQYNNVTYAADWDGYNESAARSWAKGGLGGRGVR